MGAAPVDVCRRVGVPTAVFVRMDTMVLTVPALLHQTYRALLYVSRQFVVARARGGLRRLIGHEHATS